MGGLFSSTNRKSTSRAAPSGSVSATDRAVLDLKNSRDRLTRYKSNLDTDQEKLLIRAKQLKSSRKENAALLLLRLRKHKLVETSRVESQLLNILRLVDTIVGKENEADLVNAMRSGRDALDRLHTEMSVDDVLDLMDDIQEQSDVERQINEIVCQGVGLSAVEESEIEAELEAMERALREVVDATEAEDLKLPDVPSTPLPEIPTAEEVDVSKVSVGKKAREPVMVAS